MSDREFRNPESYVAEGITRAMVAGFLRERGFSDVQDIRKPHGSIESQIIHAMTPAGERLALRVRLCWHRAGPMRRSSYSAAQILSKIRNNDWEGALRERVERERSEGITHFLFVQREAERIIYAALVPLPELLPIWCEQRDTSLKLIEQGRLGRRKKNHAMNGSSPTIWLQDDGAPEVAEALWSHEGVQDVAKLRVVSVEAGDLGAGADDTFDDMPGHYLQFGSDGATRMPRIRSGVRRDPRVRAIVLELARRECEREGCGETREYIGFLDVHHILGAEKSDRIWNCVAVCPNCHREAHAAPNRDQINAELLAVARRRSPAPEGQESKAEVL